MSDPLAWMTSAYGTGSDAPVRFSAPLPSVPIGPAASQIASANVAVTVFPAGSVVNVADVINPATAIEPLYVDFVNAAAAGSATSIPLQPGQSYRISCPLASAVTAVAATAGHGFVAVSY